MSDKTQEDSKIVTDSPAVSRHELPPRRRPRLGIEEWINLDDFRKDNVEDINKKYKEREKVNKLLNDTYVGMQRAEEINGWSSRKKRSIIEWKNLIEYQFTVNWFFVYELKKTEGWWTWLIIVISTLTSTLSLVRSDNFWLTNIIGGTISVFSVCTTLIAAWTKKQNYIERIKNLDRYIQKLAKLNVEMEYILTKESWNRTPYDKFMEVYEPQIVQMLSSSPPMAPEEFKTAVWQLTRFYPELVKDTYPWYDKDSKGNYVMTDWGKDVLKSYEAVYYSSLYRRIFSCYYCCCKCCEPICKGHDNYIVEMYNSRIQCSDEALQWPDLPKLDKSGNNISLQIDQKNGLELIDIASKLHIEKEESTEEEIEKEEEI